MAKTSPRSRRPRRPISAEAVSCAPIMDTELRLVETIADSEEKWMNRLNETATELRTQAAADQKYLNERIDSVEVNISTKLDNHTAKLQQHIDATVDRVAEKFEQRAAKIDSRVDDIGGRVSNLENWRWVIFGGAVVALFAIMEIVFRFWVK